MKEKLALVLVGGEDKKEIKEACKRCKWCEFRIDEFLKIYSKDFLKEWLSLKTGTNKIGTVRWYKEHQKQGMKITERRRFELYKEILEYVDYVDVEIKSKIIKDVVKEAKKRNKKVIASYHNFSKTPPYKTLEVIYRKGKKLNPDIIKIATKVNNPDELFTLLSFTYKYSKKFPLVVTPMGYSFVERFIPLSFGSLFTYIAFNKKTASGQISYKDILKKLQNCKI